jgi:hypothetical protein
MPATSAYNLEVASDNTYQLSVCQLLLLATWKLHLTTPTNCQCASSFCLLPGCCPWHHFPTVSMPAPSVCYLDAGSDYIYQLSVCLSTSIQCASSFCLLPGWCPWQHLPTISMPATYVCYLKVGSDYIYQLSVGQLLLLLTTIVLTRTLHGGVGTVNTKALLPGCWIWLHLPTVSGPTSTAPDNNCSDKNLTWWGRYC